MEVSNSRMDLRYGGIASLISSVFSMCPSVLHDLFHLFVSDPRYRKRMSSFFVEKLTKELIGKHIDSVQPHFCFFHSFDIIINCPFPFTKWKRKMLP